MKSSVTRQRYLYTTLAVVMGAITVALLKGMLLSDQRTISMFVGGVCVLAGLGSIARAYNAPARSREREAAALHAGLRAQMDAAAAQQERNRLARDLHDSIKQQLFSIQMSAAAAQARWENDPEGARQAVADVRVNAHEALTEMNAMLQQLSPAPLEKVGLAQALRDQCEALGYRNGAEVAVAIGDLPDDADFPPGAQEALFRIAQEALSNVARHARAKHVTLNLNQPQPDGPVTLEIRDDGQGFDAAAATNGMGLNNIRQRVEALGGKLEIQSAPGGGTTLRAVVNPAPASAPEPPSPLLNKTILVGLVGGLALLAVLFYPLYMLTPQGIVSGWPTSTSSSELCVLSVLIAAMLTVGVGYVAVRRSGGVSPAGALACGALAGGVAGLVVYMVLGTWVAGIPVLLWLQEPHPAWLAAIMEKHYYYPEDVPFSYAIAAICSRTNNALWITLLCGAGLGVLGGWLASRRMRPVAMPDLSRQLFSWLAMGGIFDGLTIVCISVYTSMSEGSLFAARARPEFAPIYRSIVAPISTLLLIYLASAGGLYGMLRASIRQGVRAALGSAQIMAVTFGNVSLGIALWTLWRLNEVLAIPTPLRILPGALLLACAGLGVLYWLLLHEIQPRWRALGLGELQVPRVLAWMFLPISLLILANGLTNIRLTLFGFILAADVLCVITLWRRPPVPLLGASARTTPWQGSDIINSVGLGLLLAILLPITPSLFSISNFLAIAIIHEADVPVAALHRAFLTHALVSVGALVAGLIAVGLSTLMLDGIMALAQVGARNRRQEARSKMKGA